MYYSLKTVPKTNKYILTKTTKPNYQPQQPPPDPTYDSTQQQNTQKRSQTQLGTHNYDRSLRRAFSRAKLLAYFNPDLSENSAEF